MEKEKFEEEAKAELEIIENNVLTNFFLDVQVRGSVTVNQNEINEVYTKEQEQFANVPQQVAFNQIANAIFSEKVAVRRSEIIEEILKKYDVEKVVKENL